MACDDASAGFRPTARIAYSRCLVEVAESVMANPVRCESATALLERRQELLNRVRYQMNGRIIMSKKKAIATLAALALIAVPLSWYYSEAAPVEPPTMKAATASTGEKPSDAHISVIEVYIKGEDKVGVNGSKTSMDSFEKYMQHAAQEAMGSPGKENTVVIALTCEDGVSMGTVFAVQEKLRGMNLMNMSYTTSDGKDLTLVLPPIDYEKRLSEIPEEHISTLSVLGGGVVVLDGRKMKADQLTDAIKKILAADEYHILSVQISEEATYGDFVTLLELAKQAEAPRILVNHPAG
jgi:biopolymer transport protein ExbD